MNDGFGLGTRKRVRSCRIHRWAVVGLSASTQERTRCIMWLNQVKVTLQRGRVWWRASGLHRVECLLLMALLIGLGVAGGGFFFGKVCSPWPMGIGFVVALIGAFGSSWRTAVAFVLTVGLLGVITALTFSYTGTDAINYHFPMQRLLTDGWNPVFDSSVERFREVAGTGCALWHTLFLPKVCALNGALLASLTGLFAADAFMGFVLMWVLACVAFRFALMQWSCSRFAGMAFAGILVFSTKITSFLAGQVDYTAYAAFLSALLAFVTWHRGHLPGDLFLSGASLSLSMLAKTTGLMCGGLVCLIALALEGRRAELRWGMVALAGFILLVGASPLLTAWIQYGSPVYPSMTFNPSVSPVDITSDFTGNEDALSMGYLSRIVYAWFSPILATKGCAWFLGKPDFSPVFTVAGGVGGLGGFFRLLMWGSVVALVCSRRNAVTGLCLFLFFTGNLAPLKYIGYARYFPQIWAIPFLAAFNLAYAPRGIFAWKWFPRMLRVTVIAGVVALTIPVALRTVAYQGRMWKFEHERQIRYAMMRSQSPTWRLEGGQGDSYTLRRRMEAAGLRLTDAQNAPTFSVNARFQIPLLSAGERLDSLDTRFPICDTPRELLRFPWWETLRSIPAPLWLPQRDARPLK